jgi:hypothetical protein
MARDLPFPQQEVHQMSTPLPPRTAGVPGQASEVDPLTMFDPAKWEGDLRAMTRSVLRPIGSPMPRGFFTVAIDSVLFSALQAGVRRTL